MTACLQNLTEPSTGERIISFIESYCVIPEGDHVGKPVVLAGFQKKFILAVYDNPHSTDTAILSIARKNAKTGTIAFLVIAHLVGPVARQNARIISGAMSREQAAEVYNLASKTVMISPKLTDKIKLIPSAKKLIGLAMNTEYQAISAEGKTAHGKSPVVAILDEVGQVIGPTSDFIDAITTSQGAYDDALLIYISTQSATDADLFSILIDDYEKNKPKTMVCHVYAADKDADVLDEDAWRAANPALGLFRSEKDMRKQAEKASRMPTFENTFRNLNLNQRVSRFSPFVSADVWKENGKMPPAMEGLVIIGGLDLSSKLDLTSAVFVQKDEFGYMNMWPYFWAPEKGLEDRANRDKVPYGVWADQGILRLTPGNSVGYEYVAADLIKIIGDCTIESLNFDRWRIDIFQKECDDEISGALQPFGQGYKDMSPAIDIFEELLLDGKVRHGMNPILTWCASNTTIIKDPAGNRKMDKQKSIGRIDGMVAASMAIGGYNMRQETGGLDDYLKSVARA